MATSGNFFSQIQKKLGLKILNKKIYKEAFTHSSLNLKDPHGKAINFERLEFLGDAILTAVIAEHLYDNYPDANEGSLTRLRAKIVSRVKLNQIGEELGLFELAQISNHNKNFGDDIHGNLLESLIGAIFVDTGYVKTKNYIIKKIIYPYVDMSNLATMILSFKAFLIEWGQREKKDIQFLTQEDIGVDPKVKYCTEILLNDKLLAKSKAKSKKKAEEKTAKIATRILKLIPKTIHH
ncbi:ribonuclease III [Flavobacteriaceae bacterium]|jgi:ribonuclease-3|nr:ribonuclease III [Flavobacteriaceae bacterium]MDA9648438.1 ribonuclease III [Flavobacteriaceae bacterium]